MSKYNIARVTFTQKVATNEKFLVQVEILDWNWIKNNVNSWSALKNRYAKWRDLLG